MPQSGTVATSLESLRSSQSPELQTDLPENRSADYLIRIKEGMTFKEVADLLEVEIDSKGTEMQQMQTALKGPETIVKLFNPDGRSFVLIFKYEKLTSKAYYTAAEAIHLNRIP